jgi:hypothetical protein
MLDGLLSEPRRTFVELLEFDGEDLREPPLTAREEVLARLLRGAPAGIALNAHYGSRRRDRLQARLRTRCEGIVSKRLGSPYRSHAKAVAEGTVCVHHILDEGDHHGDVG